jgi:hypothetical protein
MNYYCYDDEDKWIKIEIEVSDSKGIK